MGEVMIAKGEHEEALTHHARAVEILEGVVGARPDHAVHRTDLAWGYERLSFLYQQLQRYEEALAAAAKGLAIQSSLRAGDPHNLRARRGMRACYCRLGEAQLALGDQEAALANFSRFRELTGRIAAEDPDDPHAQREVGVALYKMAEFHMALASDESKPRAERIAHWTEAKSWTKRCQDYFLNLKSQGKLLHSDSGVPDEMRQEIAKCEAAIDRLSKARD